MEQSAPLCISGGAAEHTSHNTGIVPTIDTAMPGPSQNACEAAVPVMALAYAPDTNTSCSRDLEQSEFPDRDSDMISIADGTNSCNIVDGASTLRRLVVDPSTVDVKALQEDSATLRRELAFTESKVKELQEAVEQLASRLREQRSAQQHRLTFSEEKMLSSGLPHAQAPHGRAGSMSTQAHSRVEGLMSGGDRSLSAEQHIDMLRDNNRRDNTDDSNEQRDSAQEWGGSVEWAPMPRPTLVPPASDSGFHLKPSTVYTEDVTPPSDFAQNADTGDSSSSSLVPGSTESSSAGSTSDNESKASSGAAQNEHTHTTRSKQTTSFAIKSDSNSDDSAGTLTAMANSSGGSHGGGGVILEEVFSQDGRRFVLDKETGSLYAKGQKLSTTEVELLLEVNLLPARVAKIILTKTGTDVKNMPSFGSPMEMMNAYTARPPAITQNVVDSHSAVGAAFTSPSATMWNGYLGYPPLGSPMFPLASPTGPIPNVGPKALGVAVNGHISKQLADDQRTPEEAAKSALDVLMTAATSEVDAEIGHDDGDVADEGAASQRAEATSQRASTRVRKPTKAATVDDADNDNAVSGKKRKASRCDSDQLLGSETELTASGAGLAEALKRGCPVDFDEIPTTAQPLNPLKGKLLEWERELVDEFVRAVESRRFRLSRGDLARGIREFVNVSRHQDFWEKLVSRRRLNDILAHLLGPVRSRKRTEQLHETLHRADVSIPVTASIPSMMMPSSSSYPAMPPFIQYPIASAFQNPGMATTVLRHDAGGDSAFSPYVEGHLAMLAASSVHTDPRSITTSTLSRIAQLPQAGSFFPPDRMLPAYAPDMIQKVLYSAQVAVPPTVPLKTTPSSITARLGYVPATHGSMSL